MGKWEYELKFDTKKDAFVVLLTENILRKDGVNTSQAMNVVGREYKSTPKEIRVFRKDAPVDLMLEWMEKDKRALIESFVPSDTYEIEFIGDRFVGNYESNILLVKDRLWGKEIQVIGKSYTLEHGDKIVKALNDSMKEAVE